MKRLEERYAGRDWAVSYIRCVPTEPSLAATRVLIADDDPTIVLLLEHVLEGLGRQFDSADDGMSAWDLWQKRKHQLVVLDIDMPGMNGLELCRRIRAAEPGRNTFLLVVTGLDRAADLEAALEAGADDYVTKPTSGQRLTARLRIAQRRMDEEAARNETISRQARRIDELMKRLGELQS